MTRLERDGLPRQSSIVEIELIGQIEHCFKQLDYEQRERVLHWAAQWSAAKLDQDVRAFEPSRPATPASVGRVTPQAEKRPGHFLWRGKWRPL